MGPQGLPNARVVHVVLWKGWSEIEASSIQHVSCLMRDGSLPEGRQSGGVQVSNRLEPLFKEQW